MKWLLLVIATCACRTQPIDPGTPPAADGATSVDAGSCSGYERVRLPLTRLELVDVPTVAGTAIRIRAGYPWRPACDHLADTDASFGLDSGPDVWVIAHLWRSTDPGCDGTTAEATAILTVTDVYPVNGPAVISIGDVTMGGSLGIHLTVAGPTTKDCTTTPLGNSCERDCQCTASLSTARCIPFASGSKCAVSCATDTSCPDAAPHCDTSTFTCQSGACNKCRFDQTCVTLETGSACRGAVGPGDIMSCACNSDCSDGKICANKTCVVPCTIDQDCPNHGACGNTCVEGACSITPC